MAGFKEGDVLRYESERQDRHCREGVARVVRVRGELSVKDTYWGFCPGSIDDHTLTLGELTSAELLFNVYDFYAVESVMSGSRSRDLVRAEWLRYHPDERAQIPTQHGLRVLYLVKEGSSPDLTTEVENAEEAVRAAEAALSSAERTLASKKATLQELQSSCTARVS